MRATVFPRRRPGNTNIHAGTGATNVIGNTEQFNFAMPRRTRGAEQRFGRSAKQRRLRPALDGQAPLLTRREGWGRSSATLCETWGPPELPARVARPRVSSPTYAEVEKLGYVNPIHKLNERVASSISNRSPRSPTHARSYAGERDGPPRARIPRSVAQREGSPSERWSPEREYGSGKGRTGALRPTPRRKLRRPRGRGARGVLAGLTLRECLLEWHAVVRPFCARFNRLWCTRSIFRSIDSILFWTPDLPTQNAPSSTR
jgi:hypothetical protein